MAIMGKKKVIEGLLDRVMDAAAADEMTGFCLACGSEQDGCEPDAREYPCEACGERKVYGAMEIILMVGVGA